MSQVRTVDDLPPAQRELERNFEAGHQGGTKLPEIQLPGDNRRIGRQGFAEQLGEILAPYEIFRRFDRCVIPRTDERGETTLSEVTAQELRTLIEDYCAPWRWRKTEKVARTISTEDARATLESQQFLKRLRPIRALNLVRLPAFYEDGSVRIVRILPLGYCPVHQTYTSQGAVSYPADVVVEDAKRFLDSLFSEFPFVGDRDRAVAIVLAGALTLFARHLFPKNIIRPNFLSLANSEGAGKTLLLKIAMIPLLGFTPTGTAPKDEDEMMKRIGAVALSGSPVFFLDNVKGHLSSASLEALSTSPTISFRLLGQSKLLQVEHGLTIFITGNRATFSPDLRRRTLAVELFIDEVRPELRAINHPLDDQRLVELRSEILGALWALVRNWAEKKFPAPKELNQSFVAWSKVVGGILEAAGYPSPCHQIGGSAGDRELNDMERLVGEMVEDTQYSFSDLVGLAKHHHLFEWIIGEQGDGDTALQPKARSRFGKLLSDRLTGRLFSNNGCPRRFELLSKTARKIYGLVDVPTVNHQKNNTKNVDVVEV